jgi:hypothetical protein
MRKKSITKENTTPGITCTAPWRVTEVKPLANYRLEVKFIDGTHGFVEMSSRVMSEKAGVFTKLKDKDFFNKVFLHDGVVTWPGEIDLAPDAMHDEIARHGEWVLK